MLPLLVAAALFQDIHAEVVVKPEEVVRRFVPQYAFGAGVDGHEHGDLAGIYTPKNVAAMRSMGLKSLTYRLRTELGIEAWHWNPEGTWSDSAHGQGYWLSNPAPSKTIRISYGYSLPRRGSTFDQANNRGYSRIDDGDPSTFWKSNPYLDHRYTGEPNSRHPQWIVIDFGDKVRLDAAKIRWGTPYAVRYRFEYWLGPPRVDEVDPPTGTWTNFPLGVRTHGAGALETVPLSRKPILAQYVRLWLEQSSESAPPESHDVRDRLGFAIRELYLGQRDGSGRFHDAILHRRDSRQTEMIASSTDPWHRAIDRDRDVEQPGFDLVEKFGLTNGLPLLFPVPVLFGVPSDAANELRWLRSRGYPLRGIEMGEEPDGQMTDPEDYGALYLEAADKLKEVDPKIVLGGPCFQTTQHEFRDWPDPLGVPWLSRFLTFLDARARRRDLQFFSFEWYPFDDVTANPVPQLLTHETIFSTTIHRLMSEGLTRDIPWMITEYGYSAFAGLSEVELPGAILNADIVAEFLTLGGSTSFLYGYEPGEVIQEKTGAWGNLMALQSDPDTGQPSKLPTYYSAWLLTHAWCGDQSKEHRLVQTEVIQGATPWVGAYTTLRPDGKIAIMLVNRNPSHSATVSVRIPSAWNGDSGVLYQYGQAQYRWKANGENGHASRSLPPSTAAVEGVSRITLPAFSLSILVLG